MCGPHGTINTLLLRPQDSLFRGILSCLISRLFVTEGLRNDDAAVVLEVLQKLLQRVCDSHAYVGQIVAMIV